MITLKGPTGGHMFGFFAALGVLQLFRLQKIPLKMSWVSEGLSWNPVLHTDLDEAGVLKVVTDGAQAAFTHWSVFSEREGHKITPEEYRRIALEVAHRNRFIADFIAALGHEPVVKVEEKSSKVKLNPICLTDGTARQTLFGALAKIREEVTEEHYRKALFEPWKYEDESKGNKTVLKISTRAGREWWNRSEDPVNTHDGKVTVYGGEVLSLCGLNFYTMGEDCPGFFPDKELMYFKWPLWSEPLDAPTIKSLLLLQEDPAKLRERQVVQQFKSNKVNWDDKAPSYFQAPDPVT